MSRSFSAFFAGGLCLGGSRGSVGDHLQGALECFRAFIGFKLASFAGELLALGFGFARCSLFGHCYLLYLAGAFLAVFFAALFLAGLGLAFGTEGSETGGVVCRTVL